MESSREKTSFQIVNNHFHNYGSDFAYHTTLSTTANQRLPYYAKISVTRNMKGVMILGIKTFQSIMQVFYKNTEFQKHKKLEIRDELFDKQQVSTFTFYQELFTETQPPIIIGYKSGLLALFDCNKERLLGLFNYDDRNKTTYKPQSVSFISIVPKAQREEMFVVFEDSTAMRYKLTTKLQNSLFLEKIKKFENKASFNKAQNKFKHKIKIKDNLCYSRNINDKKPEFCTLYAYNQEPSIQNPLAYYKFNHRTISDLVIKRHSSFQRTLFGESGDSEEITILAFTSLDGYLVLFEFEKMVPLISYKGYFGGINSLTFSENCELVALAGQDDCITVLDLNTFTTLRCEGHRSFVTRVIFQSISMSSGEEALTTRGERDESGIMDSTRSLNKTPEKQGEDVGNVRMIGAGMDAKLSFWEFNKNSFGKKKTINLEETQLPIRLELGKMQGQNTLSAVYMESVKDAVGWVEICDNMLIQCGYDGIITTYIIRDIIDDDTARDHQPTTRREKQDLRQSQMEEAREEDPRLSKYEEQMRRDQAELKKHPHQAQARREQKDSEEHTDVTNHSVGSHEGVNRSSNNLLTPTRDRKESRENITPKSGYQRVKNQSPREI